MGLILIHGLLFRLSGALGRFMTTKWLLASFPVTSYGDGNGMGIDDGIIPWLAMVISIDYVSFCVQMQLSN